MISCGGVARRRSYAASLSSAVLLSKHSSRPAKAVYKNNLADRPVAILGATGQTGKSIANGLLDSEYPFEITALARSSSLHDPELLELSSRGVKASPIDLAASKEEMTRVLAGFDVVVSAISAVNMAQQFALIDAVKAAGVKRFVPSNFGIVQGPLTGFELADTKQQVLDYVQAAHIPYTVIEVGYWYQLGFPHLASGRTKYIAPVAFDRITGDGNTPSAYSDLKDVGKWVARIIADPRTLNKKVVAYSTVATTNQLYDAMEKASGEKIPRVHLSNEEVAAEAKQALYKTRKPDSFDYFDLVKCQYWNIMFVRAENTPEHAKYLGFLDAKELYPEVVTTGLDEYAQQAVNGQVPPLYAKLVAAFKAKAAAAGQR
ncbi:Isoflavone reductase-like protein [Paramyrothecium foliicola]|nr:Isoflavone reductase-like protein [Paramyrothecium foliicola]